MNASLSLRFSAAFLGCTVLAILSTSCAHRDESRIPPAWRDHSARPKIWPKDRRVEGDEGVLNHGAGDYNEGGFSDQSGPETPAPRQRWRRWINARWRPRNTLWRARRGIEAGEYPGHRKD